MKASPYLIFNGNCKDAINIYEKAFKSKAVISHYKDAPPSEEKIPQEFADFVMHATMPLGKSLLYLCDTTPDQKTTFGNGASICAEFDSIEEIKSAFAILKKGGEVSCAPGETFWNKYYAELKDQFGIKWSLMLECTCTEKCYTGKNPDCTCKACDCAHK